MAQPQPPGGAPQFVMQPGQQPSPEQIRAMQAQIAAEAQKAGLTVPQYVERLKQQMLQQAQLRQQQAAAAAAQGGQPPPAGGAPQAPPPQGGPQPGQQMPILPGPPKPEALAIAAFLRNQNLKLRTCIFQEKRKDMFRVKRAIRALQSDAYVKARKKNPLLPEVKDRVTAENTFKLLPRSMLALRVSKIDPHAGHAHGKQKRVKGLWTVKIEPQQEAHDDFYYVMLYEGSQWKNKLYAVGALLLILAVVFFPVWPYHLRLGVWYLSMGMLGVLGLFFGMAIVRLILFLITMFAAPPGLWIFPNLFEDVGFFDSFKPAWAWHEDEQAIKKRKKEERDRKHARREAKQTKPASKAEKSAPAATAAAAAVSAPATADPAASAPAPVPASDDTPSEQPPTSQPTAGDAHPGESRDLKPQVEEVEDE